MSVQAMSWVIDHSEQKLGPFIVLLMVANYAQSDGTGAWPSVATLAKKCRMSERQTQRCLAKLVKSGELRVEYGAGPYMTNIYSLTKIGGRQFVTKPPKGVTNRAVKGVTNRAKKPALNVTQSVIRNPSEGKPSERSAEERTPLPPREFATPNFLRVFEAYPNKIDKREAIREWCRLPFVEKEETEKVLAGIALWKASEQWQEERFIPSLAKFLRNRRWETFPPKPTQEKPNAKSHHERRSEASARAIQEVLGNYETPARKIQRALPPTTQ